MKTLQTLETENNLNKNEMLQVKGGDVIPPKTDPGNETDEDDPIVLP